MASARTSNLPVGPLSTREAAAALGVHERTLRRHIASGRLAYRKLPRGHYSIPTKAMKHDRVGQSTRAHAWRTLSAVLSWAALPEIQTNGCLLANEKVGNRRKSARGRLGRTTVRRRGEEILSWGTQRPSTRRVGST